MASTTAGRVLRGLGALTLLVALLAGLPWLLLQVGQLPAASTMSSWTLSTVVDALTTPDDGRLLLGTVTVLGWLGWATFAVAALVELLTIARGVRPPRLPALQLQQHAAHILITAVILMLTSSVATSSAAATAAHTPAATPAATAALDPATITPTSAGSTRVGATETTPTIVEYKTGTSAAGATAAADGSQVPTPRTVTVRPGDTLWALAETHLDDGRAWRTLATLNPGVDADELPVGAQLRLPDTSSQSAQTAHSELHVVQPGESLSTIAAAELGDSDRWPELAAAAAAVTQPDGTTLTDPDLIQPGWELPLPAPTSTDTGAVGTSTEPPTDTPAPTDTATGVDDAPAGMEDAAAAAPSAAPAPAPAEVDDQTSPAVPAPPAAPVPAPNTSTAATDEAPQEQTVVDEDQVDREDQVQAVVDEVDEETATDVLDLRTATGVGLMLAGGLLGLLAQQRRRRRAHRPAGLRYAAAAPAAALAEQQMRALRAPLDAETLDGLLRTLAHRCRSAGQPVPQLRAARLTTTDLELYLAEPAQLPAPWVVLDNTDTAWTLDPGLASEEYLEQDEPVESLPVPYPTLVTIGEDDDGALVLLDLEQLAGLGVVGSVAQTAETLTGIAVELATSRWADDVLITLVGLAPDLPEALPTGRLRHLDDVAALLAALPTPGAHDTVPARTLRHTSPLEAFPPEVVLLGDPDDVHAHLEELTSALADMPRAGVTTVLAALPRAAEGTPSTWLQQPARHAGHVDTAAGYRDPTASDVDDDLVIDLRPAAAGAVARPPADVEDLDPVRLTEWRVRYESSHPDAAIDQPTTTGDPQDGQRTIDALTQASHDLTDDRPDDGARTDDPTQAQQGEDVAVLEPIGLQLHPQRVSQDELTTLLQLLRDPPLQAGPQWSASLDTTEVSIADLSTQTMDHPGDLTGIPTVALHAAGHGKTWTDPDPGHHDGDDAPDDMTGERGADEDSSGSYYDDVLVDAEHRPDDRSATTARIPAFTAADLHSGATPVVQLLGEPTVHGAGGPTPASHTARATALIALLATNPGGLTRAQINDALSPNKLLSEQTVHALVSRARRWLGTTTDGQPLVASAVATGRYTLHPSVTTDWHRWVGLLGPDASRAPLPTVLAALELLEEPLLGAPERHYAWAEDLREDIYAAVVDVAHDAAQRALRAGDHTGARFAVRHGRRIDAYAEILWRDQLRVETAAGRDDQVRTLATRFRAMADDLGESLHPDTEALIDQLTSTHAPAGPHRRRRGLHRDDANIAI